MERGKTRFDRKQDGYVYYVSLEKCFFSLFRYIDNMICCLVFSKNEFLSHFPYSFTLTHFHSFVRPISQFAGKIDLFYFHLVTLFRLHFDYKTIAGGPYIMWTVWGAVYKYWGLINFGGLLSNVWFRSIRIRSTWNKLDIDTFLYLSLLPQFEVFEVWSCKNSFGYFDFYRD